jgi:HK97 family phage prohead protease
MPIKMNNKGRSNAVSMIAAGKVNKESEWSITPTDEDVILREADWVEYSRWHMGIDTDEPEDTKAHYLYPFGKGGKVYRSALIDIKQRGTVQKAMTVVSASDACLTRMEDMMGEKKSEQAPFETRTLDFTVTVEERAGGKKKLCGHAAVFNQETVIGGWFREIILPGAFTDTIQEDDQRALFNHDSNFVLGRKSAGTLELSEDQRGLAIEITPPDTQLVRDMVISPIERGDINQMSFSFRIKKDKDGKDGVIWEEGEEGMLDIRKIKRAQVYDVSPVTFPAYNGTDIALRSMEEWRSSKAPQPSPEPEPRCDIIDLRRKRLSLKNKEVSR